MRSSYMEKPQPHFSWEQWQTANRSMETRSQMRLLTSDHVRQVGDHLRNSVTNTIKWKLKESNNRLEERIADVEQWYKNLERTLTDTKDQIQRLSEAKLAAEKTLQDVLPLQEIAKEVMNYRDRRREIDLVEDEPYHQSKKELKLIDISCETLRNLCHDAWEQLLSLNQQRDKLVLDLKNKETALKIDHFQLSLTPKSLETITLKPSPLVIEGDIVDLNTWLSNCIRRKQDAEDTCVKAMQKTNDIWGTVRTALDDIDKQREVTERALRKRIHATAQVRDKLGAQRSDISSEIQKLETEMKEIESLIREKLGNVKLAQTRLESRKFRPGMELCSDFPHDIIQKELKHVTTSREILEQHLKDIKNQLNGLQHQLHLVEDDLERKERSLAIDKSCLEGHSRPPKAAYKTNIAWRAPATSLEFSLRAAKDGDNENPMNVNHDVCSSKPCIVDQGTMTAPCEADEYLLID